MVVQVVPAPLQRGFCNLFFDDNRIQDIEWHLFFQCNVVHDGVGVCLPEIDKRNTPVSFSRQFVSAKCSIIHPRCCGARQIPSVVQMQVVLEIIQREAPLGIDKKAPANPGLSALC